MFHSIIETISSEKIECFLRQVQLPKKDLKLTFCLKKIIRFDWKYLRITEIMFCDWFWGNFVVMENLGWNRGNGRKKIRKLRPLMAFLVIVTVIESLDPLHQRTIRPHLFFAILISSSPRQNLDSIIVQTSWTKEVQSKAAAYFQGFVSN